MKLRLGYERRCAFLQHSVPTRLRASGYGRTRLWTTPSELDRPILTPSRHTIGATALATAGPLCFVRRFRARRQVFEGWSVLQFNKTASRSSCTVPSSYRTRTLSWLPHPSLMRHNPIGKSVFRMFAPRMLRFPACPPRGLRYRDGCWQRSPSHFPRPNAAAPSGG